MRLSQPDDRVLVLFGVGHAYWLNLFGEDSHAFRLVRPGPWLVKADAPRR